MSDFLNSLAIFRHAFIQQIFIGHLSLNNTLIYGIHTFCGRQIKSSWFHQCDRSIVSTRSSEVDFFLQESPTAHPHSCCGRTWRAFTACRRRPLRIAVVITTDRFSIAHMLFYFMVQSIPTFLRSLRPMCFSYSLRLFLYFIYLFIFQWRFTVSMILY